MHTLRACSVLAIPSPMERMPPPGGFPNDLSGLNLSSWAGLIQDVVQGLWVVPPNLNLEVCLTTMVLLQLLEATTGVGFCRFCCRLTPRCMFLEAYQWAPTKTWSQVMEQIPGHGVAASSGGPTTPSIPLQRHPNTRCLHRASPFRTSPIGTCLLLRLPHPGDYLQLQEACPALGGQT